jgi:hypothetical protein
MFSLFKKISSKTDSSLVNQLQEKIMQLEHQLLIANKDCDLMTSDLGVLQDKKERLSREVDEFREAYENMKLQNDDYKQKFELIASIVNGNSLL